MERYEDDIVAWLWRVFIETNASDPYILLRLPMTKVGIIGFECKTISIREIKAAWNAMEIGRQMCKEKGIPPPATFVVSGISKVCRSLIRKLFLLIYFLARMDR